MTVILSSRDMTIGTPNDLRAVQNRFSHQYKMRSPCLTMSYSMLSYKQSFRRHSSSRESSPRVDGIGHLTCVRPIMRVPLVTVEIKLFCATCLLERGVVQKSGHIALEIESFRKRETTIMHQDIRGPEDPRGGHYICKSKRPVFSPQTNLAFGLFRCYLE